MSQTVPVKSVVLLPTRIPDRLSLPEKISKILNDWLDTVNLDAVDYILRTDGDTVLPLDFIERYIERNADVAGASG